MQLTANEKTYQAIRVKLESGQLGPGDKLVTRTLAEEMGVSLSPVREALNRLASEGLVDHTPGAGAEVKRLTIEELNDLYVLREAIEGCAAGLAAELHTRDDIEDLEFIVGQQSALVEALKQSARPSASKPQMRQWVQLEETFHETIIRIARNRLLAKIIRDHRTIGRIFESHLIHDVKLAVDAAEQTLDGKRKLIAVFKQRDPELARSLMAQQIRFGRRHVIGLLRQRESLQ